MPFLFFCYFLVIFTSKSNAFIAIRHKSKIKPIKPRKLVAINFSEPKIVCVSGTGWTKNITTKSATTAQPDNTILIAIKQLKIVLLIR